ncbi:MAG TPA: dienelactone hydrolase family protein [Dehalococcoidia bacterium]
MTLPLLLLIASLSSQSDSTIVVADVSFPSGRDDVPGILVRPNRPGRFPAVILIHANSLREPYIGETAARIARWGFVVLAVDVFHFLPRLGWEEHLRYPRDSMNARLTAGFREDRLLRDIGAGVAFLRGTPFTQPGGVQLIGFCGGGWNALLVAAQSQDIASVVAFYAPVVVADSSRRSAYDVHRYITMPVQYHRATEDPYIVAADVDRLVEALRAQQTPIEVFTYQARHGFVATNRTGIFDPQAAELAWSRVLPFLRAHAGAVPRPRPLAPPPNPRRAPGATHGAGWVHH